MRNIAGVGDFGQTFVLQIGDVPGAPTNIRTRILSDGKVTVTWHAAPPPEDGAILKYEIHYQLASKNPETDTWNLGGEVNEPMNYIKLSRNLFDPGVSYRVRVRAVAATGPGAPGYVVKVIR